MPTYKATQSGYRNLWQLAKIRPEWQGRINKAVAKVDEGRARYEAVQVLTGVPWQLVGVLHWMESACNWRTHLHNGDPLSARTHHVPAGRPKAAPQHGEAYTWEESAIDALMLKGLERVEDWSIERVLYEAERYNGFGYYGKTNSPYLWSGTNLYSMGKYIADGKYSSSAVSKQVGVVPILKELWTMSNRTLASFLGQFSAITPQLVGAINGERDHVARLAIVDAIQELTGDTVSMNEESLDTALRTMGMKVLSEVITNAESAIAAVSHDIEVPVMTSPVGTAFDLLFGGSVTGWKTYITIGLAVAVNGAAALGIAPELLTPQTVTAIDTVLAGFGGASLISKIERLFKKP